MSAPRKFFVESITKVCRLFRVRSRNCTHQIRSRIQLINPVLTTYKQKFQQQSIIFFKDCHRSTIRSMFNIIWLLIGILAVAHTVIPALPEAPSNEKNSKKEKHTHDCKEFIAFSSFLDKKNARLNRSSLNTVVVFDKTLIEKATGYNRDNGIFTAGCSGFYMLTFTVNGERSSFSLRKRPSSKTTTWNTLVTTENSGGSYTIFMNMEIGEEVAVFLDSGTLSTSTHTFSGYRISTKI